MQILVTGAAGFIGADLSQRLLSQGHVVVGVDNLNDYYDVTLKHARLAEVAKHINAAQFQGEIAVYSQGKNCPINTRQFQSSFFPCVYKAIFALKLGRETLKKSMDLDWTMDMGCTMNYPQPTQ